MNTFTKYPYSLVAYSPIYSVCKHTHINLKHTQAVRMAISASCCRPGDSAIVSPISHISVATMDRLAVGDDKVSVSASSVLCPM